MCREGIPVSSHAENAMNGKKDLIHKDPGLRYTSTSVKFWVFFKAIICREIFINPETNDTWKEGDTYKRKNLADTLERIATYGANEFYHGKTGQNLVNDIKKVGGIITMEDLEHYK